MAHSRLAIFAAAAALALSATAATYDRWRDRVEASVLRLRRLGDWLRDVVASFREWTRRVFSDARAWIALRTSPAYVEFKQYQLRQAERPRIFPGWRMCPST